MKWKDLTQRLADAKNTALETAQQYQDRLNTVAALGLPSADKIKATLQTNKPPPPPPPPPPFHGRSQALINLKDTETDTVIGEPELPIPPQQLPAIVSRDVDPLGCYPLNSEDRNLLAPEARSASLSHDHLSQTSSIYSLPVDNCSLTTTRPQNGTNLVSTFPVAAPDASLLPYKANEEIPFAPSMDQHTTLPESATGVHVAETLPLPNELEKALESALRKLEDTTTQLNEARSQEQAARDIALAATRKVEDLQEKISRSDAEYRREQQNRKEMTATLDALQQRQSAMETKLQHTARANDELQQLRVELQSQLHQVLETNEQLRSERDQLEKSTTLLKRHIEEYEREIEDAVQREAALREALSVLQPNTTGHAVAPPPQVSLVQSPLFQLAALPPTLLEVCTDRLSEPVNAMRPVISDCDDMPQESTAALNSSRQTSPGSPSEQPMKIHRTSFVVQDTNSVDDYGAACQRLSCAYYSLVQHLNLYFETPLPAEHSFAFSPDSTAKLLDCKTASSNNTVLSVASPTVTINSIVDGLTQISEQLTCAGPLFGEQREPDHPPRARDISQPAAESAKRPVCVQDDATSMRLSSESAVSAFTELLTVLQLQTLELQHVQTPGEIERIAANVHFVLETIEERIPLASGRLALSSAARELFTHIIQLAQRQGASEEAAKLRSEVSRLEAALEHTTQRATQSNRQLRSQLRDISTHQTQLEEEISQLRSARIQPPTKEDLDHAQLEATVVLRVRVPDVGQPVWCCLVLAPRSRSTKAAVPADDTPSNATHQETKSLWTPGVFWWPLHLLEKDQQWSSHVHEGVILQDSHCEEMLHLQKALEERETKIKYLEQRLRTATSEFAQYKLKAAEALSQAHSPSASTVPHTIHMEPAPSSGEDTTVLQTQHRAAAYWEEQLTERQRQVTQLTAAAHEKTARIVELEIQIQRHLADADRTQTTYREETTRLQDSIHTLNARIVWLQERLDQAQRRNDQLARDLLSERTMRNEPRDELGHPHPPSTHGTSPEPSLCTVDSPGPTVEANGADRLSFPDLQHSPCTQNQRDTLADQGQRRVTQAASSDILVQLSPQQKPSHRNSADVPLTAPVGAASVHIHTLRRALRTRERQLDEERQSHGLMRDQMEFLKKELRRSEALLHMRPFTVSAHDTALSDGVPIKFVRHTVLRFIETGLPGPSEHEALLPVLASIFSFSSDEINRIYKARCQKQQSKWLLSFS